MHIKTEIAQNLWEDCANIDYIYVTLHCTLYSCGVQIWSGFCLCKNIW